MKQNNDIQNDAGNVDVQIQSQLNVGGVHAPKNSNDDPGRKICRSCGKFEVGKSSRFLNCLSLHGLCDLCIGEVTSLKVGMYEASDRFVSLWKNTELQVTAEEILSVFDGMAALSGPALGDVFRGLRQLLSAIGKEAQERGGWADDYPF